MTSVSTPPAQLDSDSEDEITFQPKNTGLRLVKGSLGSSEPNLVACVSMDEANEENSEPNVKPASSLRQKAMMARKKQAVKVVANKAEENENENENEEEDDEMLVTQHESLTAPLPKTATLSESLASDFDESAFLPDSETSTQPVTQPTPPAPPTSTSSPPITLSNNYSPETNLPKYSESEFLLKVEAERTKIREELKGILTEEIRRKCEEESRVKEEEYTKEFTELLEVSEAEQNQKILTLQTSNTSLTQNFSTLEKTHASTMALTQSENDSNLEDLLTKLDQFESDHNAKILELQKKCQEKDAVVGAIAPQLAEANAKNEEREKELTLIKEENEKVKEELEEKGKSIQDLEAKIEQLKKQHDQEVKVLKEKRVKAVEKMRLEMTKDAEAQFAAANQHYHKLKEDYKLKVEECKKMEKAAEAAKSKATSALKKFTSLEEKSAADISNLKLQLATMTAKEAETTVSNRRKLSTLESTTTSLSEKITLMQSESDAACMNLGKVVGEKEALVKENADLQSVCEELMALVEANGIKGEGD